MRNHSFRRSSYHRLAVAAVMVGTLVVADGDLASAQVVARTTRADAGAGVYRPSRPGRVVRLRVSRSARRPVLAAAPVDSDVWAKLRRCESGGRYDVDTGNGFYGAYQFVASTWRGLGYAGLPHQAPPEVQDEAAQRLQARSGWGQWPVCSRRIGAR